MEFRVLLFSLDFIYGLFRSDGFLVIDLVIFEMMIRYLLNLRVYWRVVIR